MAGPPTSSARASARPSAAPTMTAGTPVAATPLAAGTYVYDTSGTMTVSGQVHQLPPTTTLVAGQPEGDRQLRTRDLKGSGSTGQITAQTLAFDRASVQLEEVDIKTYPGGNVSDDRDLFPTSTATLARTGPQPGDHQAFTLHSSNVTANVSVDVQRIEQVSVGGTAVTAAVVQMDTRFSGAVTGQQSSTLWVTAEHLQVVRERVTSEASDGVVTVDFDYTATLHSLAPS